MEVAMKSEIGCHWAPWSLLQRLMVSSVVDVHIPLQVMRRWPWSCTSNVRIRILGEFHDDLWPKTMKRWFEGDFFYQDDFCWQDDFFVKLRSCHLIWGRWYSCFNGWRRFQCIDVDGDLSERWPVEFKCHLELTLCGVVFSPGWETKLPRDSLKEIELMGGDPLLILLHFWGCKQVGGSSSWNVFLVQRTVLFVDFVDWGCRQLDLKKWTCFETYLGHAPTRQNDRWRRGTDNWGSKRGNVVLFHFELKQPDVVRL